MLAILEYPFSIRWSFLFTPQAAFDYYKSSKEVQKGFFIFINQAVVKLIYTTNSN